MAYSDDLALWCALNQLIANYWADVDQNGGRQAHEFYLPDGLYAIGNNRFEGKEKIEAFYTRRRSGTVMTRHLISNLRVLREDEPQQARIVGIMTLYRADGRSPFQGARPPAMIVDFEAQCVLVEDRLWRFQSHVLRPFIVGSDFPASIMINPRTL
jgi:SnoaL-like domain